MIHDLLYRYKVYIAKLPRNYQYLLCITLYIHPGEPGEPWELRGRGASTWDRTSKTSRLCEALRNSIVTSASINSVIGEGLRLVTVCTRLVTRISRDRDCLPRLLTALAPPGEAVRFHLTTRRTKAVYF